jgi:S-phase kinase-associated protein 1
VLEKVIQWCEHHKDDPPSTVVDELDFRIRSNYVDYWDQDFINVDEDMIFDIILVGYTGYVSLNRPPVIDTR